MSRFGDLVGSKKVVPTQTPTFEVKNLEISEFKVKEESVEEFEQEEVAESISYESDVSLHDMSKKELEEYGRTVGIELDRRHSRKRLVQELEKYLSDS